MTAACPHLDAKVVPLEHHGAARSATACLRAGRTPLQRQQSIEMAEGIPEVAGIAEQDELAVAVVEPEDKHDAVDPSNPTHLRNRTLRRARFHLFLFDRLLLPNDRMVTHVQAKCVVEIIDAIENIPPDQNSKWVILTL